MNMHFDVLFLDVTAPYYYDRTTLDRTGMGGTEATVVRIAEGLAALGLKVAVMQSRVAYFPPIMGQWAFFIHSDDLDQVTCRHYVQIRKNDNGHLFPDAKKYLWMHDVAKDKIEIAPSMKVIAVSRWHKNNIKEVQGPDCDIAYIYNPVQDELFIGTEANPAYNKDVMAWTASPHKGLKKALELFKRIKEQAPKMQLIVFNPGYMQLDMVNLSTIPGVIVHGVVRPLELWSVVQKALCVFYPTDWSETFGLIAAEANALGTPVITSRLAALKEVVSSNNQFADSDDEVVKRVLDWRENGRPRVYGKEEFKFTNVILEWVKLLAKCLP